MRPPWQSPPASCPQPLPGDHLGELRMLLVVGQTLHQACLPKRTGAGSDSTGNSAGGDRQQRHIQELGQGSEDGEGCAHRCTWRRVRAG